jgi:outer membrane receptor protein involved in Fe transport
MANSIGERAKGTAASLLASVVSMLATAAVSGSAIAQEQQMMIEEIIVTATKREQTLQEVPVAVSVVSEQTMERAQVLDIKDLQTLVPSLRVTQLQTTGNTNFIIRGFGNGANNAGIEPSVGVFVDGVYRSRSASALADLPNLERVEVLRGPQSTLFGKNASAGVI